MSPTEVIGRMDLLPTMMDEGTVELGGRKRERDVARIGCSVVRHTRVSNPLREREWLLKRHRVEGVG
jgi:hypothetical protein